MEGKINEAFQNDTYLSYYDHKKAMAKGDDLPGVASKGQGEFAKKVTTLFQSVFFEFF